MSGDLAQTTRMSEDRVHSSAHATTSACPMPHVLPGKKPLPTVSRPANAQRAAATKPPRAVRSGRKLQNARLPLLAAGLVAMVVGVKASGMLPSTETARRYTTVPAVQGPLRISVHDEGTIDSLNNSIVKNAVEWRTKILWVAPEGSSVEKGEVICELDASEFRERAKEREIILTRARASLKQARESLEIQKSINERNISAARLKVELAELALQEYRDGTYKQKLLELENACTLAEENLSRSRETYEYSKRLAQKGYKTQSELEASRLALTKSEVSLQAAREKRKVLDEYTSRRELAALEGEARDSKFELTRVKMRASLLLTQAKVRLAAQERATLIHQNYYDRILRNIEACTIRAPRSGELVYASSRSRHNRYPIDEGADVRHRQEFFALPDLSQLKVDVRVHEAQSGSIRVGQRVLVRVNAASQTPFNGKIHAISSMPRPGESPNYDLREYIVTVKLDESAESLSRLKPGLTASVEIILHELPEALQVPARSIVNVGEHNLVYVQTPLGPEVRHLKLGPSDDQVVVVEEGLEPGEEVIESPRTELSQEIIDLRAQIAQSEGDLVL